MALESHGLRRSYGKLKTSYYHSTCGHQIWQVDDLPWLAPACKVSWLFRHVGLWDHMTKSKHIFTTTDSVATKLGRMVTYHDGPPPIESSDHLIMWPCKITWQTKNISTTTVPMATKLGREVIYLKGLLPINSHGSWVTWSCKITWQFKNIISLP